MSRWINQFKNHAFNTTWASLKEALDIATVDDKSVLTSVEELTRLKKVIAYLDAMITNLDIELVPITIWDSFQGQAVACLQNVNTYISNRNIGHIQNANAHADNLITYIRPYMVVEGKAARAMQAATKEYAQAVNQYIENLKSAVDEVLEDTRAKQSEAATLLSSVSAKEQEISNLYSKLFVDGEDKLSIQTKTNAMFDDIANIHQEASDFHNDLLVGTDIAPSTKKIIIDTKQFVSDRKDEIESTWLEAEKEIKEIESFHTKIFGKEPAPGAEREGGLLKNFQDRIKELGQFETKQQIRYQALNDEIETLLPGATSAGLATAYKAMKESFDKPIAYATAVYLFSIYLMIAVAMFWAIESFSFNPFQFKFIQFSDWQTVLKSMMTKLPIYIPVVWLAIVASKRRSESQRLQQEYAHKEALAKSYESYKKQLEALDDRDKSMQKELINKAIDAIIYNPSQTLDGKHGDNHPLHEMMNNAFGVLTEIKSELGSQKNSK